ncbi:MAG: SPOR domain-containing protein [Bacteroidota bacterium]
MNFQSEIYLQNAFRELDAFSLPGIGTFRKVRRAAELDETTQRVIPPMVEIELDSEVRPSLLFARYLVDNLQMPVDEAQQIVEEIKDEMILDLKQLGTFEITNFGHLRVDGPGSLRFHPHGQGKNELADEYFGLKPLHFTRSQTQLPVVQDTPLSMKQTPSSLPSRSFGSVVWKSTLLVGLLAALGIFLLKPDPLFKRRSTLAQGVKVRMLPPDNFASGFEQESQGELLAEGGEIPAEQESSSNRSLPGQTDQSDLPTSQPPAVAKPTSQPSSPAGTQPQTNPTARVAGPNQSEGIPRSQPESTENQAAPNQVQITDTNDATNQRTAVLPAVSNYHLIVGSFSSQQAANRMVSELKKDQYDPIILFPPNGSSQNYRVSVYRNAERFQVERFSYKWIQSGHSKGWIFEERPQ